MGILCRWCLNNPSTKDPAYKFTLPARSERDPHPQGLRIDFLHEFPFCAWEVVAGCTEVVERFSDSHAYLRRPGEPQLPLLFSLKATKDR